MTRLMAVATTLVAAACSQAPGEESGGTETTGTTEPMTTTTSDGSTTTGTSGPTTGGSTSPSTTDEPTGGAVCTLPPLSDELLETLDFNVFGASYDAQPGQTLPLAVGSIECCYVKNPVDACITYSVTPSEGASIDADGNLTIAPDAAPGTVYTVIADVEDGRALLSTEVWVYTPESNPLVGIWHEVAQLPCGGGAEVPPESPIGELRVRANGEALVTWMPFEIYVDYWSEYTLDVGTGDVEITPIDGNYLPDDIDGVGTIAVEGDQIVLKDMWLGSPQGAMAPAQCGHRFER